VTRRALGPRDTDHELMWTAVGLACAVLAWLAVSWNAGVSLAPCAFKALTGWPCLTCGGTRAVGALLSLDVGAAWRLNPIVTAAAASWTVYAMYGIGALAGTWPRLRVEVGRGERTALRVGAAACTLATWVFLIVDGR
jgi:hypothetical protein